MYQFNFFQKFVFKTFGVFSVAGIALSAFLYFLQIHDQAVRLDERSQCNIEHVEEVKRQNAETNKKLQDIEVLKRQLSFDTLQRNNTLSQEADAVNRDIDNFQDRPASEILKKTFRDLQEIQ